jgi:hypothetical protein
MRSRRILPRDLLLLWGALFVAFVAIGILAAYSNDCAATDSATHLSYTLLPGIDKEALPIAAREALTTRLNRHYVPPRLAPKCCG